MISVKEAKELIKQRVQLGQRIRIPVTEAIGFACAEDITSPIDFPSYRQSAMDGYAFRYADWQASEPFYCNRIVQAGDIISNHTLLANEAVRLFTGAAVPNDANTIVMQEHVSISDGKLRIHKSDLALGANIRPIASQNKKGELVFEKGNCFTSAGIGLLSGLGISELHVIQKPGISIITTGKELVKPGNALAAGQIFESNSFALQHALHELHIDVSEINAADDNEEATIEAIKAALEKSDIVLITGGVSVGDYDFVVKSLQANGVEQVFHKVKQKPGKPLYFGTKNTAPDQKLIFGLPGNPGSVLTCFYEYVVLAIKQRMGFAETELPSFKMKLLNKGYQKQSLTHFIKAKLKPDGVIILDHQESYKMNAFAQANCFIVMNEDCNEIKEGDEVELHLFT